MNTRRTPKQWRELLACRNSFDGTNIEFCQHHRISITSFYKHQASIRSQSTAGFVHVKTTTEQTRLAVGGDIQFDTRSGQLTLPASLSATQVVNIIKGLSR